MIAESILEYVLYGLLAAVSRIAAILPSDLAPTNMNGPLRTSATDPDAAPRPVVPDIRRSRKSGRWTNLCRTEWTLLTPH